MIVNEAIATDDFTICNEFQNHFISVGWKITDAISPFPVDITFWIPFTAPNWCIIASKVDYRGDIRNTMYAMNNRSSG